MRKSWWDKRPDIDPDFDPKEVAEDLYKHYTYQELLDASKPMSQKDSKKMDKWKQFDVSAFDSYEKIFYDIANSKKAKRIYIKTNIISILFCFARLIPLAYIIFASYGFITSCLTNHFIFDRQIWVFLLIPACLCLFWVGFIDELFKNYVPISRGWLGKIDTSHSANKTSWLQLKDTKYFPRYVPAANIFIPKILFLFQHKRPVFKNKYNNYIAINGNKYLVDVEMEGRYYSMRNWYLISKYITLGKMSINELNEHFEDELFFYITNKNYKNQKLKLRCHFNKNFSLYAISEYNDWLSLVYFIAQIYSIVLMIVSLFINMFYLM